MPVVKLYANLRKLAGTKELSITEATVGDALNALVKLHPAFNGILLENGELRSHVVVTLNGRNTSDMKMQITEQDVMAIFPPIAGG